jgi:hypothetical protein
MKESKKNNEPNRPTTSLEYLPGFVSQGGIEQKTLNQTGQRRRWSICPCLYHKGHRTQKTLNQTGQRRRWSICHCLYQQEKSNETDCGRRNVWPLFGFGTAYGCHQLFMRRMGAYL